MGEKSKLSWGLSNTCVPVIPPSVSAPVRSFPPGIECPAGVFSPHTRGHLFFCSFIVYQSGNNFHCLTYISRGAGKVLTKEKFIVVIRKLVSRKSS